MDGAPLPRGLTVRICLFESRYWDIRSPDGL